MPVLFFSFSEFIRNHDRCYQADRASRLRCLALYFVLMLIYGCSPLVQQPGNLQQSPVLDNNVFITSDGVRLPVRLWRPSHAPKAVLVSLHGFNDYSNGIATPAQDFINEGIFVIAYDQRGFGNAPNRGIWPGHELLARDAAEMVRLIGSDYPGIPVYLLGDSMGAAVALAASVEHKLDNVEALILVAPAVWGGDSFNWFYRSMLWLGAHLFRWNYVTGRSFVTFSDNEAMIRAFRADPNVISKTRLDAVYGMRELMDHAQALAPRITMPLYVLYGKQDEVIPMQAVCLFLSKLDAPYLFRLYEQGFHFLLRDLNNAVVRQEIVRIVTQDDNQAGEVVLASELPAQCRKDNDP